LQVANFGGSQPVPEGQQDHGLVAMRPAIAPATVNQPLDLRLGEVFSGAQGGVPGAARGLDFPYLGVWRYDFQGWFWHIIRAPIAVTFCKYSKYGKSARRIFGHLLDKLPDRGRQKKAPAANRGKSKQGSCEIPKLSDLPIGGSR
jgi:hypothetical protein